MKITCHQNILFNSNSYIIETKSDLIIIDPSDDDSFIDLIVNKNQPTFIFLTHEHFDHISGVKIMKEKFKINKVISTNFTSKSLLNPKQNLSFFYGKEFIANEADIIIEDNFSINLNNLLINLYLCKGHSLGGMLIVINNCIFCGDEFIYKTKTVTKLPGGNLNELYNSYSFLKTKFDGNTKLYPGHGKPFIINELKIWK